MISLSNGFSIEMFCLNVFPEINKRGKWVGGLELVEDIENYLLFILTKVYKANITMRYARTRMTIKTFVIALSISKSITR